MEKYKSQALWTKSKRKKEGDHKKKKVTSSSGVRLSFSFASVSQMHK